MFSASFNIDAPDLEVCEVCGGELCELGPMGARFLAVRCRQCGHDQLVVDPATETETEA